MDVNLAFANRDDLSPHENLAGFITSARESLKPFGPEWRFDDDIWDLTTALKLRGRGNKATRITFFKQSAASTVTDVPIGEPMLSFAKAYITFMQSSRPIQFVGARLYALKSVAFALEQSAQNDIVFANDSLLSRAAQYIQMHYSDSLAYRVGQRIEELADFLRKHKLTNVPLNWKNFIPRPSDAERVGIEFDKHRADKMPTKAALDALPKLFNIVTEPADVLAVSIAAILVSTPDRINELFRLPLDCEVTQSSRGNNCYGLRWWPSKGADPQIKYVVSTMSTVVQRAIADIRRLTEPARQIALWYENHPGALFLAPHLQHLRAQKYVTTSDIVEIVGVSDENSAVSWLKWHEIDFELSRGERFIPFRAVERAVLEMLPRGFPLLDEETGLKYGNALIVVRKNELHARRSTYRCMIEPVGIDQINGLLGAKKGQASIFDRFGFTEPDGSQVRMTTHQFRYYLNTLAHIGGLSELDIAKWSGRVSIRDNPRYDLRSPQQIRDKIREVIGDGSIIGPMASLPKTLITRKEFVAQKFPTAHPTVIGHCIRDYSEGPCRTHMDCICCELLVCIKGDSTKNAHIRQQLEESVYLLEKAQRDAANRESGADRWIEHYRIVVERLTQLCAIVDDPTVPNGAVISLKPPTFRLGANRSSLLPVRSLVKKRSA